MSEGRAFPGRTGLGDAGYQALRHESSTYRERLVVRLAGEAGVRPAEMAEIRPADVSAQVHDGAVHYFLSVPGEDGEQRDVYFPAEVKRELDRYVQSNGIEADEPVFTVSPRRLQMLVSEVAGRAAEVRGEPSLADVSSADLRRHFARKQLQQGVPPSVVMAVGGWRRLDSIAADATTPDRASIAAAFERSGTTGDDRFRAAFDRLDSAAALLDADGVIEHANRRFEAVTGLARNEALGCELRDLAESVEEREYAAMWEAVVAGEWWSGDVATRVPDGEPVRGRLTVVAIGAGPRPDGFVATFQSHDETGGSVQARRTLDRLRDVQLAVRAAGDVLADITTRAEALEQVCTALAESDAFHAAWAADDPADGQPSATVIAGDDGNPPYASGDVAARLASRALRDREVRTTTVAVDEGETLALAAIPLVYGDTRYGTVTVARRSPNPAGERERAALGTLGERVAETLAAVEWKRLLLADAVIELEFEGANVDSLFARASTALDCHISVEGIVPLEEESLLYYVTVSGAAPEDALSTVGARAANARLLADYSEASLLEVTVEEGSLPGTVIERGANVTSLEVEAGHVKLGCEVAPNADVRALATGVSETFPAVNLVAKREVERSVETPTEFQRVIEERLTSKQRSVVQAAYHAGYFDWPRESTAEELADSIGVSSPTLHNHLRRAQRKLLAAVFDEPEQ